MNGLTAAIPSILASALLASSAADALYNVVPIAPPAGWGAYSLVGLDINSQGDVVGEYSGYLPDGVSGRIGAFIYTDAQGIADLTIAGFRSTSATGINGAGQIALSTAEADGTWHTMYRYTPGVGLQQLDTFGGLESETGRIDASGRITGYSQPPSQINFAFRSTTGTELQNLGSLFGGGSRGYDINSFGWVVGVSDGQNAFLYRDRLGMTLITPGVARGLNDAGMVVGYANLSDGSRQAFAYENGTLRYLTVSGNQNYAFDVNSLGTIVGQVDLQATIWSDASGQQNLNWLIPDGSGWDLLTANAINDAGQITGQGIFNGQIMGYRLDLVPEPAIWVLSPLGLVSFLFSRWYPRSRL